MKGNIKPLGKNATIPSMLSNKKRTRDQMVSQKDEDKETEEELQDDIMNLKEVNLSTNKKNLLIDDDFNDHLLLSSTKSIQSQASKQISLPKPAPKVIKGKTSVRSKSAASQLSINDDDNEEEEEEEKPVNKRSIKPKSKSRAKSKSSKTYIKGRCNLLVNITKSSKCLEGKDNSLNLECCKHCSNRNVLRAVKINSSNLLIDCINATDSISSLQLSLFKDSPVTPLSQAIKNNNRPLIKAIMDYELDPKRPRRCYVDQPKLSLTDTGENSELMVGVRTMKLNITRGNKMGNNALLLDDPVELNDYAYYTENIAKLVMTECNDPSMIDYLRSLTIRPDMTRTIKFEFERFISAAARLGNHTMAGCLLEKIHANSFYGFNALHSDVLNMKTPELQVKVVTSLTKKPQTNDGMTPMHLVCINPDTRYVEKMIQLGADWNVLDLNNRKPLHYAAACESEGPLNYLLSLGALIDEGDKSKKTPLMIACESGRDKNVLILIKKNANVLLKQRKPSNSAIHYAAMNSYTKIIKILLENSTVDIDMPGQDRMTPLMFAAFYGHLELVNYLLDKGAKVIKKDKFRRTALLHSCRSGQSVISSILLAKGSEYQLGDSSKNTPIHYACAYGWSEIVKLLLQAGADPNEENMWRIKPLEIAFLKNHFYIVKQLLNSGKCDINTRFNKDMTLLHYAFGKITYSSIEEIGYLINDKQADINLQNYDGNTCLHFLAKFSYDIYIQFNREHYSNSHIGLTFADREIMQRQAHRDLLRRIFKLLNTRALQKELVNTDGRSALHLAFEVGNIPFIEETIDMNLKLSFRDKNGITLLHLLPRYVFGSEEEKAIVPKILNRIKKTMDENELDNINNAYDMNGFTPLLGLMYKYEENILGKYSKINQEVMYSLQKSIFENSNNNGQDNVNMENDEEDEENEEDEEEDKPKKKKTFKQQVVKVNPFTNPFNKTNNTQYNESQIRGKALSSSHEKTLKETTKKNFMNFLEYFYSIVEVYISLKCNPVIKVGKKSEYRMSINKKKLAKPPLPTTTLSKNERIEMQYYNRQGKKTILMYLMSFPYPKLLTFFLDNLNLDINELNLYKENALFSLIYHVKSPSISNYNNNPSNIINKPYDYIEDLFPWLYENAMKLLIVKGIHINQYDYKEDNPFNLLSKKWNIPMMKMLYDNKADVNVYNKNDENALLYQVKQKCLEKVKVLIEEFNADINSFNTKKRGVLHYLYNDEVASTDTDDSLSLYLLNLRPIINCHDISGRTPLHYLFIKIGNEYLTDAIDPIVSLSQLMNYEGIDLEALDIYGNTPLHYAAQRGASICLLTLLSKSIDINRENIEKNTALSYSLIFNQHNISISLFQQHAAINCNVYPLMERNETELIRQMRKRAERESMNAMSGGNMKIDLNTNNVEYTPIGLNISIGQGNKTLNTQMNTEEDADDGDLDNDEDENDGLKKNVIKEEDEDYDSDNDRYSSDDYSDSDDSLSQNGNAKKQATSNPFFQPMIQSYKYNTTSASRWGMPYNQPSNPVITSKTHESFNSSLFKTPKEKMYGNTLFKICILKNFQGLTYLLLTSGYNLMKAIEDSFYTNKFNLAMQLLKTSKSSEIYTVLNDKNQNLFHILGKNSTQSNQSSLKPFFTMLSEKAIDLKGRDFKGNTPLHYASKKHFIDFCQFILSNKDMNQLLSIKDAKNRTPYILSIYGKNIFSSANFIKCLFDKDTASTIYQDNTYEEGYQLSPLIHAVRMHLLRTDQNHKFIMQKETPICQRIINQLIDNGCSIIEKDSKGIDCLIYCIIDNDFETLKALINRADKTCKSIPKDHSDLNQKTLVHYCVNINNFGSYENEEMLKYLISNNFNCTSIDSYGLTPLDYAKKQLSGVNLNVFKAHKIGKSPDLSVIGLEEKEEVYEQMVDYEKDAEALFKIKENEVAKQPKKIKPNLMDYKGDMFELWYDDEIGYWNASCTKVNIMNGLHGEYMFYFIQLIHDKGKKMYIVTTQFGRIGEEGANQRSPFNSLEEAQNDFRKVFKSKTGNVWDNKKYFQKIKGKYCLLQLNEVQIDHKELLHPIDYNLCPQSLLGHDALVELMKDITDSSIYFKSMKENGINTDSFKFSMLSKELILKARDIMLNIISKLNQLEEIRKSSQRNQFNSNEDNQKQIETITNIMDNLYTLSSAYYELIPKTSVTRSITPFTTLQQAKNEIMTLNNLVYVEKAVNILLGAQYNKTMINPLDYIYNAFNTHIQVVDQSSSEYLMLNKYINTTKGDYNKVTNIFRLSRKGENDNMKNWAFTSNHFLLFHGTKVFNFIGIFSNGLKIAPPEAPTTGYLFGKGLYFADMFSKSINYCDETYNKETHKRRKYMLLCEVVLGNTYKSYMEQEQDLEFLKKGYNSLKSISRQGPNDNMNFVMNNGMKIPLGKIIDYDNGNLPYTMNITENPEYVIYDTTQAKLRYLIQLECN